ncbi:ArsR/SmtB family transcription factor [Kitasatospora sp. NPDC101183]|uniref:ArsR/SmtB family transcription factor n=1 Tax=Kitasatospora sp. NPDC101183 TaxID=3364100 RepID=UPI0038223EB7
MPAEPNPQPEPQLDPKPDPRPDPQRITDLTRLKAFTNPLRMQLYRLLFAAGSATASQLAEQIDQAPSLVSYHLRKLAELGFVTEAPGRSGDGRERWWRLPDEEGWSFRDSDFRGSPEGQAAVEAVGLALLDTRIAQYRAYLSQAPAWSAEWTDAAFASEWMAELTAAELDEMGAELNALARRWRERGQAARESGDTEGREHVSLHLYGFPFRP